MPIFFVLLMGLALRAVTLPGAGAGLRFLFHVDLSKITLSVVVGALGQAFFSLSLGMGAMITYGSYLSHDERLPGAAFSVAAADTAIALLAGLIIFPAVFAAGGDPGGGPGLVFVTLPSIFHHLPLGGLFAVAFYALLAIAALTSTISLLEVVVSYFVDEKGWSRERTTWLVTAACFLLAVPSALSETFLGWQNVIFGNYGLTVGALLICLFVGWKWGIASALEEIARGGSPLPLGSVWGLVIRYVAPLAIAVILAGVIGWIPGVEF
ncbi:MAG: sodium-dependent transporter [Acidobacteriota bacterium]|nr:sodium-dependent transporter [Acidobacteriota bacterium]